MDKKEAKGSSLIGGAQSSSKQSHSSDSIFFATENIFAKANRLVSRGNFLDGLNLLLQGFGECMDRALQVSFLNNIANAYWQQALQLEKQPNHTEFKLAENGLVPKNFLEILEQPDPAALKKKAQLCCQAAHASFLQIPEAARKTIIGIENIQRALEGNVKRFGVVVDSSVLACKNDVS